VWHLNRSVPFFESAELGEIAAAAVAEQAAAKVQRHPWPKKLPEQVQALRRVLVAQPAPLSAAQLARQFSRVQTMKVEELLQTLAALGQVREAEGRYSATG